MARAIWKGVIQVGKEEVPVKLYTAVEDRSVHFRLLHEKDLVPVKQHMVHPESGDVVESDEMRRGHEVEPGVFVVLEPGELAEAEPEPLGYPHMARSRCITPRCGAIWQWG